MKIKYFGAASSAHQVEGDNKNSDWWEFEKEQDLENSGKATNHYQLFDQDFELAKSLSHNAHRFSVEWAKIEPQKGKIDKKVLNHYHQVFASLKKHQLEPFVTLHHFTLPAWFAKMGGFEKQENLKHFIKYAKLVLKEFSEYFSYVFTINEPYIYSSHSYYLSVWPPKQNSIFKTLKVNKNLKKSHIEIYKICKQKYPKLKVGIARNLQYNIPYNKKSILDKLSSKIINYIWNYRFLDQIKDYSHFIGVNYYTYNKAKFTFNLYDFFFKNNLPKNFPVSDLKWPLFPKGLYFLTQNLSERYNLPIVISENGLADAKDSFRPKYIQDIFAQIVKSNKDGAKIIAYLHWSLTDNFEWHLGFGPRFGLIQVDYLSYNRKIRKSAKIYKKLIDGYRES